METPDRAHADESGDIWRKHAAAIRNLYLTQRKTLKEVKRIMESEHGFPQMPLSTWEAKVRMELKLRKKLKPRDWSLIYQHVLPRLEQPNRKSLKKATDIIVNDTKIPWNKVWKEIRRSRTNALSSNQNQGQPGPLPPLPVGVVIRTPSPIEFLTKPVGLPEQLKTPGTAPGDSFPEIVIQSPTANQTSGATRGPGTFDEFCLTTSAFSVNQVGATTTPWIQLNTLLDSLFNGEANLLQSGQRQYPREGTVPPWTVSQINVKNLPTNEASNPQSMMAVFCSEFPVPPPRPSQDLGPEHHLDQRQYIGKAMYLLSNCLHDPQDNDKGLETLHELLAGAPRQCLTLLRHTLPSIRAAWEALVQDAQDHHRENAFELLVDIGIRNSWVRARSTGHDFLFYAVKMRSVHKVQSLIHYGCSVDSGWHENRSSAIVAALDNSDLECAHLLIKHSNINGSILVPREQRTGALTSMKRSTNFLECIIKLDKDNIIHMHGLELLLSYGSNVDEPFSWECGTTLEDSRIVAKLSELQRPTILDHLFYFNRHLFDKLIHYSRVPTSRITRVGILLALEKGQGVLQDYISEQKKATPPLSYIYVQQMLETVLAEQILLQESSYTVALNRRLHRDVDLRIVGGLVQYGVSLRLPTMELNSEELLLSAVLVQLKNHCTDDGLKTLDMLIGSGASIRAQVIKQAVQQEGVRILEYLEPHVSDFHKEAALALAEAARLNNFHAVEFLWSAGVKPNSFIAVRNEKLSVLAIATLEWDEETGQRKSTPNWEMMKHLVQLGAELVVHEQDLHPFSFLRYLLQHTSSELFTKMKNVVEIMTERYSISALPAYLLESCFNLAREIELEERDERLKAFEYLFRHGAQIRPGSPLAVLIVEGGREELVQQLTESGADINAYSGEASDLEQHWRSVSCSALQAAAMRGNEKFVAKFLSYGADVNCPARGEGGKTALQALCSWKPANGEEHERKLRVARLLLDNGADINAPPARINGFTSLQSAAAAGDLELAMLLVHRGANVNAPPCGYGGHTALDAAASKGRLDMVKLLLNFNALSYHCGETGYDGAIQEAEARHHFAVAELIRAHAETYVDSNFAIPGSPRMHRELQHSENERSNILALGQTNDRLSGTSTVQSMESAQVDRTKHWVAPSNQ